MEFKLIFKGYLDFGNKRRFERALEMGEKQAMNIYKKDLSLDLEEIFDEENFTIGFGKLKVEKEATEKNFNANAGFLAYISQYAISGEIHAWKVDPTKKKKTQARIIEPQGDRTAIINYTKGCELLEEENPSEFPAAISALDKAISKHERHAQAYERRGLVNLKLKKYHDAERDFNKSIGIDSLAALPHYGLGVLHKIRENAEAAIASFDNAIRNSIPLQPIYCKAKRRKAEMLIVLERYEEAAKELKFFVGRDYETSNPNHKYLRKAYYDYGYCQHHLGFNKEASQLFDEALAQAEGKYAPELEKLLFYRGLAKKEAGLPNFESDLKQAADAGNQRAAEILGRVRGK